MFINRKVQTKVLLLSAVMLVIVCIIGGFGYFYIAQSKQSIDSIYYNNLLATQYLNDASNQLRAMEVDATHVILLRQKPVSKTLLADLERKAAAMAEDIQKLKQVKQSEKAIAVITQVESDLTKYRENIRQAESLQLAGRQDEVLVTLLSVKHIADAFAELTPDNVSQAKKLLSQNDSSFKTSVTLFVLIILVSLIVGGVLTSLISRSISKPLEIAIKHLDHVARRDFGQSIPSQLLERRDEVGNIVRAIATMKQSLTDTILKIKDKSQTTVSDVGYVQQLIEELDANTRDISASAMESSSRIEESAAAAQEIKKLSDSLEGDIDSIVQHAQDGEVYAEQINERAAKLKESSLAATQLADQVYKETKEHLAAAIEEAKIVSQINMLSEDILKISSQTNLLALNAAIEAARAGEAGKGFSVVAEEVRKLAEQSNMTAGRIQQITNSVLISVNNLSKGSFGILEFIDNIVKKDYEAMEVTAQKYSEDAKYMKQMASASNLSSQGLANSVRTIVRSMEEIAQATMYNAEENVRITEKVTDIATQSGTILSKTTEFQLSSSDVLAEVSLFSIQ
ncbi:methyl-accepting chemotaxis protein [Propionispora vibrioides]|jgi:methyl-accepting chemotaxis protein|uniref:Methyl-accepting chemotaxis protein n=1 Tax=Propionispora vibrioides TaxID=112903 RepID=A0A1H8W574_9FIRM|nr:methyl-accepting chemotaxis protein [Propionispora vibrioides]SEP22749.1 methyl-accepting chemotaxis protein [Propionispora vibrioides]